jgi:multisubunit Na+/H+ antiporter MnhE subunit
MGLIGINNIERVGFNGFYRFLWWFLYGFYRFLWWFLWVLLHARADVIPHIIVIHIKPIIILCHIVYVCMYVCVLCVCVCKVCVI